MTDSRRPWARNANVSPSMATAPRATAALRANTETDATGGTAEANPFNAERRSVVSAWMQRPVGAAQRLEQGAAMPADGGIAGDILLADPQRLGTGARRALGHRQRQHRLAHAGQRPAQVDRGGSEIGRAHV